VSGFFFQEFAKKLAEPRVALSASATSSPESASTPIAIHDTIAVRAAYDALTSDGPSSWDLQRRRDSLQL
jgi:hypothetical protein